MCIYCIGNKACMLLCVLIELYISIVKTFIRLIDHMKTVIMTGISSITTLTKSHNEKEILSLQDRISITHLASFILVNSIYYHLWSFTVMADRRVDSQLFSRDILVFNIKLTCRHHIFENSSTLGWNMIDPVHMWPSNNVHT